MIYLLGHNVNAYIKQSHEGGEVNTQNPPLATAPPLLRFLDGLIRTHIKGNKKRFEILI